MSAFGAHQTALITGLNRCHDNPVPRSASSDRSLRVEAVPGLFGLTFSASVDAGRWVLVGTRIVNGPESPVTLRPVHGPVPAAPAAACLFRL